MDKTELLQLIRTAFPCDPIPANCRENFSMLPEDEERMKAGYKYSVPFTNDADLASYIDIEICGKPWVELDGSEFEMSFHYLTQEAKIYYLPALIYASIVKGDDIVQLLQFYILSTDIAVDNRPLFFQAYNPFQRETIAKFIEFASSYDESYSMEEANYWRK